MSVTESISDQQRSQGCWGDPPSHARGDADVQMQRVTDRQTYSGSPRLFCPFSSGTVPSLSLSLSLSTPWRPQRCRACFTALCRARQRCASAAASHSPAEGVGGCFLFSGAPPRCHRTGDKVTPGRGQRTQPPEPPGWPGCSETAGTAPAPDRAPGHGGKGGNRERKRSRFSKGSQD